MLEKPLASISDDNGRLLYKGGAPKALLSIAMDYVALEIFLKGAKTMISVLRDPIIEKWHMAPKTGKGGEAFVVRAGNLLVDVRENSKTIFDRKGFLEFLKEKSVYDKALRDGCISKKPAGGDSLTIESRRNRNRGRPGLMTLEIGCIATDVAKKTGDWDLAKLAREYHTAKSVARTFLEKKDLIRGVVKSMEIDRLARICCDDLPISISRKRTTEPKISVNRQKTIETFGEGFFSPFLSRGKTSKTLFVETPEERYFRESMILTQQKGAGDDEEQDPLEVSF